VSLPIIPGGVDSTSPVVVPNRNYSISEIILAVLRYHFEITCILSRPITRSMRVVFCTFSFLYFYHMYRVVQKGYHGFYFAITSVNVHRF